MIEFLNLEDFLPDEILNLVDEAAMINVLSDLGDAALDYWATQAKARLFTSRRDYVQGLQAPVMGKGQVVVALVGEVPNLIEHDQDERDLHDTLLGPKVPVVERGKGRGKHKGAHGFYRAVPFRHSVPGMLGAVGPSMGTAYRSQLGDKAAAALGAKVYAEAKKLKSTTSEPGKGTAYGKRLKAGLAPILKTYEKNKPHATDIYAGMIRERKKYQKETQTKYTTFRTISENPDTRPSWIRPSTTGVHIAKDVQRYIERMALKSFAAYVGSLGS